MKFDFSDGLDQKMAYVELQATICFSFLWLFSLLPIRQRFYEFFVLSHIVLALVALVGTF